MSKKDKMADILNVTPLVKENNVVVYADSDAAAVDRQQQDEDIAYVRSMMYDTIKTSHDALEEMLEIAKQSQHPRAFEVVAALLNTMREANKDLLDLHKKRKDLRKEEITINNKETINNNLFVGTTQELLDMLKKDE